MMILPVIRADTAQMNEVTNDALHLKKAGIEQLFSVGCMTTYGTMKRA